MEAIRKQIFAKTILIVLCSVLIVIVDVVGIKRYIQTNVVLVETCIASRDIPPRTCISEADIVKAVIPYPYLQENTYTEPSELIGKYTDIQGKIPAGSPFYTSMVYDVSSLPDHPELLLKEGQAAFSFITDVSGISDITSGQRIDLYASVNEGDSTITGRLLRDMRVLSIRDHNGLDIENEESNHIPYLLIAAVNREDVDLLTLAVSMADLRFIASSDAYDTQKEAGRDEETQITSFLLEKLGQ